jgi:hypothetical protein
MLVLAVAIGASACSSSGPSAAAKSLCGSVVASIPANTVLAIDVPTIKAGEDSGSSALDQAVKNWMTALNNHNTPASKIANQQVITTCEHLGIPLGKGFYSTGSSYPSG